MTSTPTNSAKVIAFSDGCARQPYQTPKLSLFGDVGSLTETGSMNAMEDFNQNSMCVFANMTGNMC